MHLIGLIVAIAIVALCSLLPFLPGRFDNLAVALSGMAQVVGTAGLLPVPLAALLLAAERAPGLARWRLPFMVLTVLAAALAWALVSLGALVYSGVALALIALGAGGLTGFRIRRAIPHTFAHYLVAVPIAAALFQ